MVKVRGRQQQRGCALGQGAASAPVTDTKTDARTKAAVEGAAGRLRPLQGRCAAASACSVRFPFQTLRHPSPPRPDPTPPDTHTPASTSIPIFPLRHPNPTFPLSRFFCIFSAALNPQRSLSSSLHPRFHPAIHPPSCLPLPPPPAEPAEGSFACGEEGVGESRSVCGWGEAARGIWGVAGDK